MRKQLRALLAATIIGLPTAAFAAPVAGPSTVNSAAIIDGTIATVDIANGAVTGVKIANGTITATQIAPNSVANSQLANGAVTDAKIVSVNAAKLFGQISTSRLRIGTTPGTVAAGNHTHSQSDVAGLDTSLATKANVSDLAAKANVSHDHDGIYSKKYANVIVVAKDGGDYTDPIAAMASISNASEANPYLIKIMPGVYNIGSVTLALKQFVDVEGAGQTVTRITGTMLAGPAMGVVTGASNAEMRELTIENIVPADYSGWAVYNLGVSPKYTNVSVLTNRGYGIVSTGGGTPVFNNVSISVGEANVGGIGIWNSGASSEIRNSRISVSGDYGYGILTNGTVNVSLANSTITAIGASYGVYNQGNTTSEYRDVVIDVEGDRYQTFAPAIGIAEHGSCKTNLSNVKVKASGVNGRSLDKRGEVDTCGTLTARNSVFESGSIDLVAFNGCTLKFFESELSGYYTGYNYGTLKLVNSIWTTVSNQLTVGPGGKCVNVINANFDPVSCL